MFQFCRKRRKGQRPQCSGARTRVDEANLRNVGSNILTSDLLGAKIGNVIVDKDGETQEVAQMGRKLCLKLPE